MADWLSLNWEHWGAYLKNLKLEDIQALMDRYSALGPLPGIFLPFLEALLPFLPLIVIVIGNSAAYGLWPGFFYSWIGVCLGAMAVFMISRWFGRRYGERIRQRFPKTERFFTWVEQKGFTPIFLLSCFPFSPSALVNVSAGLSKMPLHTFMTAIILGKAVMIFTLSFLGYDLKAMVEQPWRIGVAVVLLFVMWFGGKKLEARYGAD
ncbi:TVP38/TMEM64 family protein [Cohnella pontilimi]|uniref:TVP38/TMEM64 family membrane protein n=2 Tax=Cohnella pontilimi TaxID=2564100 RepID=A0A4U0F821_9BACL|nr:TVP38/TMEM64 family protein [Cohnella pontilimi]TJY40866.1 TVP38/TMEM64 family protein [Cohnella pontilimi]